MRVVLALALIESLVPSAAPPPPPRAQAVLSAAARTMSRFGTGTYELGGSIDAESRTGVYREAVRMRDGAFVVRSKYRLFGESDGFDGRVRWRQDRSGATHSLNAPFSNAEAVSLAWLKRRGFLQQGSARIERVKHETIDGQAATVLTMRPRGGNPIRLAFDDASHLLVRVQRERPLSTVTETYGDYRRVGNAMAPFKIEIEDSGDIQSIHATGYKRLPATQARFSAPPPRPDTTISGVSTLALDADPADGHGFPVVPARINGRDYEFILDTGGHNIISPTVAAELGLAAEGKGSSGGSGPGRVATSDTMVAELKLGSATMRDQYFTVLDLGNALKRSGKSTLGGMLGLEVFERMAMTLDEPRGRLTIEPFKPGRGCEGDKIPLLFDDDQPSVQGRIDGIPALIGIDTGNSGIPIALWRWAEAHKVADRFRSGEEGSGSGVGGNNVTYRTPHHHIVIGRTALRDIDVNYAVATAGYFSSRTDSMNVGRSLLQKYVVRFDYAGGHMCVIPPRT